MVSTKNGGHHCGYSKLRSAVGAGRTLTLGAPVELVRAFGGKPGYQQAIHDLEAELYGS